MDGLSPTKRIQRLPIQHQGTPAGRIPPARLMSPRSGDYSQRALLPESAWASAPAQLAGAGHCVRGLLADGSSFSTLINSDGTTHFNVVSAVPVPAAAWLLGSALAGLACLTGLTGLRRRR